SSAAAGCTSSAAMALGLGRGAQQHSPEQESNETKASHGKTSVPIRMPLVRTPWCLAGPSTDSSKKQRTGGFQICHTCNFCGTGLFDKKPCDHRGREHYNPALQALASGNRQSHLPAPPK